MAVIRVVLVFSVLVVVMSFPLAAIEQNAAGSGFIVTSDGYILTNYHVVNRATKIEVRTADGAVYSAAVVAYSAEWSNSGNDLALLKIEGHSLPTIPLGDSDKVQLFDDVVVLGFPLSFQLGATVSATGGHVTSFKDFEDTPALLQIDAAINPGNSGGPLLNMYGEVIGIPTATFTGSGSRAAPQGVNWAVPVNYARSLLRENIPGWKEDYYLHVPLTPQQVVTRALPAVVYIKTSVPIPLASLLPVSALGKTLDISEGYPFSTPYYLGGYWKQVSYDERLNPLPPLSLDPFVPASRDVYIPGAWYVPMTGARACLYSILRNLDVPIDECAEASGTTTHGGVKARFTVMSFDLGNPKTAAAIRDELSNRDTLPDPYSLKIYISPDLIPQDDPLYSLLFPRSGVVRAHASFPSEQGRQPCYYCNRDFLKILSSTTINIGGKQMNVLTRYGTVPMRLNDVTGLNFIITGRAVMAYEDLLVVVMLMHSEFVPWPSNLYLYADGGPFFMGPDEKSIVQRFTPSGTLEYRACESVSFGRGPKTYVTLGSSVSHETFEQDLELLLSAALAALGLQ